MQTQKGVSTLIGIIIIIAVAVVAVGGVFAYQYFATKTQPVVQTQQNQNTNQTAQPSITVTSPNGGEQWVQGSTHNITWNSSNAATGMVVDIWLYDNRLGGATGTGRMIGSAVPYGMNNYSWTIPNDVTLGNNDFKIQFRGVAGAASLIDESNNYFSITN